MAPDMTRQASRTPPHDAYVCNSQCIKTARDDAHIFEIQQCHAS